MIDLLRSSSALPHSGVVPRRLDARRVHAHDWKPSKRRFSCVTSLHIGHVVKSKKISVSCVYSLARDETLAGGFSFDRCHLLTVTMLTWTSIYSLLCTIKPSRWDLPFSSMKRMTYDRAIDDCFLTERENSSIENYVFTSGRIWHQVIDLLKEDKHTLLIGYFWLLIVTVTK